VIITVLSYDMENDPDIVAMVGRLGRPDAFRRALHGPIGGARVGMIDGEYVLNPLLDEMEQTDLDLVVAGTQMPC
jgi:polyribonucleotide nucleotidyltransferase